MTKNKSQIKTISSKWTAKQIHNGLHFGLVIGGNVLVYSLHDKMNVDFDNKHIYNTISSQLTVENNNTKYSYYINKFCIFSILNHLKAGATL